MRNTATSTRYHAPRDVRAIEVHDEAGWLRVDVYYHKPDELRLMTHCVVGYDGEYNPVTSPGLLLPKDTSVHVRSWGDVVFVKMTQPTLINRVYARQTLHVLASLYGVAHCDGDANSCGCEFPLGAAWQYFEALDAHVAEKAHQT